MSSKQRGGDKGKAKGADGPAGDAMQAEAKRIAEIIAEASKKVPAQVAPYVKQAAPYLATAIVYFLAALPYIVQACSKAYEFVQALPEKVVYASLGFAVCFFGGIFPATIAAVEAWRLCGGNEAYHCCEALYEEFLKVAVANKEDESKDKNKDGIPDAQQLPPQELILRKVHLAMVSVDPERVSEGIVGLSRGWIGVLAILKIQFARTVTLGARIGEQAYAPASKFEPRIAELVPEEYRKWVPVVMRYAIKVMAISIAWWIQRAVSTIHSAIRGGLLFGKYLVDFLHEKGYLKGNADQVYLDEAIGWVVAVAGLLFQFSVGLFFPLNILLLPVRIVETVIVWSVAAS